MKFEWDQNKDRGNQSKHGISFDEAKEVFGDSSKIELEDSRRDYGEKRITVIGMVWSLVLFVVYTFRSGVIRIISARRANKAERAIYQDQKEDNQNEKS